MRNRKGLSGIVTTLIIILLVIVSISIVWVVIRNLIDRGAEDISIGRITANLEIKKVVVQPGNLNVTVERKTGEGEISSLNFVVFNGKESETIKLENINLDEFETKTFSIPYDGLVKEISVTPNIKSSSGGETSGSTAPKKEFTNKEIIKNLGAVSWWRFEDKANDEIGENHGTPNGATPVSGRYGQAYRFDSINSNYIMIPFSESLNFGSSSSYTISAWVNFPPNTAELSIISHWDSLFPRHPFELRVFISGRPAIYIYDGSISTYGSSNTLINNDRWHHVVGIKNYDNDNLVVYVDGVIGITNPDVTTGDISNSNNIYIGSRGGSALFFNGIIDEVIIFNRSLTANEIQDLYNFDFS